jgi:prephenate dehydrogenase
VNAAAREPEMLQAVANGFIDTTRVASSDVDMWMDIFMTNRAAVASAIDVFSAELEILKRAIAAGDEAAIRAALSAAKRTRDELLEQRRRGNRGGE